MRLSLVLVIVNGCGFTPGVLAVVLPGDAADSDTTLVDAEVDARKFDACATCPANDVSGGPEQITGTIVLTADLTNAHDDIAVSCGGAGGRDLFYELVVPTQQVVYVDTSTSTADTALALYAGPCAMEPAETKCSNDPCPGSTYSMFAQSLAAGTYCIVVDEATTNGTGIVLDVFFAGRDGTELTGTPPYVVSGDTCTSTDITDPPCENLAGNSGTLGAAKDQMYWYTKCTGTTMPSASTCGAVIVPYDSIVTIRGRSPTPTYCVDDGCGAGNGSLVITSPGIAGPTLVQVTVDGWNTSCGGYTLTVTP